MFDVDIKDERNFTLHLIVFIIYLLVIIANNKKLFLQINGKKSNFDYRGIFFWMLLICVFHFVDGDYYTTMQKVHEYRTGDEIYGLEPFYLVLSTFLNNNYLLFRLFVWGAALIAYCIAAKLFKLPLWFSIFILFFTNINTFAYARFTLAAASYFLAVALILNQHQKGKLIWYLLGFSLIALSIVFHKSAFILVAMTLILIIPVNRYVIIAVLILIPFLIPLVSYFFDYFLLSGVIDNDLILNRMEMYAGRDNDFGIARKLMGASRFFFYYVEFIVFSYVLYWKTDKEEHRNIKGVYKITAGLVVGSVLFLFAGEEMETFFYRVLNMAMIPLTLIFCYLCCNNLLSKRTIHLLLFLGFVSSMTKFLYASYLAYYLN